MATKNERGRGRPVGSGTKTGAKFLLKLPPALLKLADAAAKDARVSRAEWWRRAGAHYLSCAHAGVLADED
jgi:hypothetical protein